MTPQDFRVGNIFHRKHGKGWTETEITPEIMGNIFTDTNPEYAINDFEPIELSEEWLKKAGGEYCTGKTGRYEHRNGYWWINKTWFKFERGKLIFVTEDYDHSSMIEYHCELDYVHQLQNLTHALTGNELIFNHG